MRCYATIRSIAFPVVFDDTRRCCILKDLFWLAEGLSLLGSEISQALFSSKYALKEYTDSTSAKAQSPSLKAL